MKLGGLLGINTKLWAQDHSAHFKTGVAEGTAGMTELVNPGREKNAPNWCYWTKGLQDQEAHKYSWTDHPLLEYSTGLRAASSRESLNFLLQI